MFFIANLLNAQNDEKSFENLSYLSKDFYQTEINSKVLDTVKIANFYLDSLLYVRDIDSVFYLNLSIRGINLNFYGLNIKNNRFLLKNTDEEINEGVILIDLNEVQFKAYYLNYSFSYGVFNRGTLFENVKYIMRLDNFLYPVDKMKIGHSKRLYQTIFMYNEDNDKLVDFELLQISNGFNDDKNSIENIDSFTKLNKMMNFNSHSFIFGNVRPGSINKEYKLYPLWYFGSYGYF